MKVDQIMTTKIVTVEMDDSLSVVRDIFAHAPFHHLLVVDAGKLYGIISDRDLFKALSPALGTAAETAKDSACLHKKAHQIMSRNPITLAVGANIYTAIDIFVNKAISCIPVLDAGNKPVGIISWRDILKAMAARHKNTSP
jgi:acetoin utilization protein AcuB